MNVKSCDIQEKNVMKLLAVSREFARRFAFFKWTKVSLRVLVNITLIKKVLLDEQPPFRLVLIIFWGIASLLPRGTHLRNKYK